jgi:hypothetical protein
MLKKQSNDFMATSQRNHEAFMAQQESSFRNSQNGAITAMNARTTAASDWVDYDQRRPPLETSEWPHKPRGLPRRAAVKLHGG